MIQRPQPNINLSVRSLLFSLILSPILAYICHERCDCDTLTGECISCIEYLSQSYGLRANSCYPCPLGCIQCAVSLSPPSPHTVCTMCTYIYRLDNADCVRYNEFTLGVTWQCEDVNCMYCKESSPSICVTCAYGYNSQGKCLAKDEVPRWCIDFDFVTSRCVECIEQTSPSEIGSNDIGLHGIYLDPISGACIKCPEGCTLCTSPENCTGCQSRFWSRVGTKCERCTVNRCTACRDDQPDFCTGFQSTYYNSADGLECLPCSTGCSGCSGPSPTDCNACDYDNGYFGIAGYNCKYLRETCVIVDDFPNEWNSNAYCLMCKVGYFLMIYSDVYDVVCEQCPEGCSGCISSSECTVCQSGYFLTLGRCESCSTNCDTCTS